MTLLALAAGAVLALRTRGTSDDGTASGDELVSLAPVLVAVIAALVLVRLYPLPLRGLARPARRMRGWSVRCRWPVRDARPVPRCCRCSRC